MSINLASANTPANVDKVLLSVDELAASLGLGRTSVYQLIDEGEFEILKIGRCTRVTARSRDAFVDRRATSSLRAA